MFSHHVRVIQEGGVHLVELTLPMQVDSTEFDKLNEALGDAAERQAAEKWVVDLTQVEYVGSAMLGLLVNLRQRIKSGGGRLVLCGLSDYLTKALQTCSLHSLFVISPRRPDAMKKVASLR